MLFFFLIFHLSIHSGPLYNFYGPLQNIPCQPLVNNYVVIINNNFNNSLPIISNSYYMLLFCSPQKHSNVFPGGYRWWFSHNIPRIQLVWKVNTYLTHHTIPRTYHFRISYNFPTVIFHNRSCFPSLSLKKVQGPAVVFTCHAFFAEAPPLTDLTLCGAAGRGTDSLGGADYGGRGVRVTQGDPGGPRGPGTLQRHSTQNILIL